MSKNTEKSQSGFRDINPENNNATVINRSASEVKLVLKHKASNSSDNARHPSTFRKKYKREEFRDFL
ncbi:MAG TPA: hypothetical protein VM368_09825 [Flavisolibacter sp.]|nr:hypothetical protein [Flavisolibacter sp.]